MGLFNDVSSGLEGLVKRGNVGGLFLNVAHGVSDSAAKVSSSHVTGQLSHFFMLKRKDYKFCIIFALYLTATVNVLGLIKLVPVVVRLKPGKYRTPKQICRFYNTRI